MGKKQVKGKPKTRTFLAPIDKLEVCPHNPRKRDLDIDELTESIKQGEIKEVIEVHPHGKLWHIMAGKRRFLAARKAGKTEIECLEYQFDEKQAEDWCIHEAFHKKEYHPSDMIDLSVRVVEKYGSISKASKATGISESKLKKYYGMRGLSEEVKEKIGSQGTKAPAVETLRRISKLPKDEQNKTFEIVVGKTRSQAVEILDKIEGKAIKEKEQVEQPEEETGGVVKVKTLAVYQVISSKAEVPLSELIPAYFADLKTLELLYEKSGDVVDD